MKATGFEMFIRAIKAHCMTMCQRERCYGCAFEPWSERQRQIRLFEERRARIAAARRTVAQAAAR